MTCLHKQQGRVRRRQYGKEMHQDPTGIKTLVLVHETREQKPTSCTGP